MKTISVIDPLTGNKLHEIAAHSKTEVALKFQAGRDAQVEWANRSAKERAGIANKIAELLVEREEQILDLLQKETGKSKAHAFEELTGALGAVAYYAKTVSSLMRRKRVRAGVPFMISAFVEPSPVGVVGIITPWNYPLALTMMDVIPALMAGNAVVQKADNQTAKTVQLARDLSVEAGIAEDIWQVVHGDATEVGNAVTDHADFVAFTGSTATGKLVAARAASRLVGYSLELGGKNPMIVLPGADLEKAAEIAIGGAFGNSGQLCVAIERLYVSNHDLQKFELVLKRRVESLKLGSSNKFDFDLGALTSSAQLERVSGFVDRAKQEGAVVLTGGRALLDLGPNFYAPTVITQIPQGAEILHKEVFGPVIALVGYEGLDQAIELSNASEYGLNASVVGNRKQALQVASKLMAGSVNINEGYRATMASMAAPMGGMKQSGMGRRSGPQGLLRFTESRTIGVSNNFPIKLPTRARQYLRLAPIMTKMVRWMGKL
jgi:succinate-semialdehyde dehydrogenase/glutarate-semialdehyde dehydrogenase